MEQINQNVLWHHLKIFIMWFWQPLCTDVHFLSLSYITFCLKLSLHFTFFIWHFIRNQYSCVVFLYLKIRSWKRVSWVLRAFHDFFPPNTSPLCPWKSETMNINFLFTLIGKISHDETEKLCRRYGNQVLFSLGGNGLILNSQLWSWGNEISLITETKLPPAKTPSLSNLKIGLLRY